MTDDLLLQLRAALGTAYRLEKELGGGGMSRVYLAEEVGLGRRVVVKVLPPELGAGINVDRFRRETQLAASLQHPHIVPLLTAGAAGDLLYYTMPLIEGESLRARLTRERELPVRDVIRVLCDVADALSYAHGRGVIHRDVKPDNVLLSGGHALVTDFGIAKALSQAGSSSGLTSVGVAIGTPHYMAPEQAAGDPNVDHRADIYSFGAMAYEMLTGRAPFSGMSPHQVLAAHVTERIEPVSKRRPQLPRPLTELVMWCLEKNPADRPQSAAELVPLLEGMATPTGSSPSVRFGRRRPFPWARVAVATALVGVAVAVWLGLRASRATALEADRVAVAPFDVLDPSLTLWREGLVDVLSRSLDGAGPLRTVSPTIVVKRWGGRADGTSARALGRSTGARIVVYGQLLGAGRDSVRLQASVLDVATGAQDEIELHDTPDRVDRLADSLTIAVLRSLGRTRAIGAVRGTPLGSRSLPALKAFLQGEQFLRRSRYDSALAYHQQAIAQDSTFVLALSHASMASGWQHSGSDSLTVAYALAAGRLNHGLAPRESLIVQADSLSAVAFGGPQPLGGSWWTYGRRLIATLDEAVRRYPTDPEIWYSLGDARFHLGVTAGIPRAESLDAFDRAIALDSSFSPAYIHAVGLALQLRGPVEARRYADGFLKVSSVGRYADLYRLFDHLLDPRTARSNATGRELDSLAPTLPFMMNSVFDRWPDSAETQVRLARAFATHMLQRARTAAESAQAREPLGIALAYRGHLADAYQERGSRSPFAFAELAMAGAIPRDSAAAVFEGMAQSSRGGGPWLIAWAGTQGDTLLLLRVAQHLKATVGHIPRTAPVMTSDILGYMIASSEAYLNLARGDTAKALSLFLALPDSACFTLCGIDALERVQLLEARGRPQEALAWLDRTPEGSMLPPLPSDVLRTLVRGRLQERLGQRDSAIEAFAYVTSVWARADSVLQPFVTEARAGLARLNAEPKR